MLAPGQKAHFDVFGFVIFRQAFNREEIEKITSEAEIIWEERRKKNPSQDDGLSSHEFVELRPTLTNLLVDDRIHGTIEGLLGPNFIFAGSEGQVTCHRYHGWHTDRPGDEEELSYHRIKVMIYLDPLDKNNGCLRVIPGSHRLPLHGQIEPEERHQHEDHVKPFGITGPDMPGFPLECRPGDIIFFNHSLWHGMFNGTKGRRYLALKFAAPPITDKQLASLRHYTKHMFEPADKLLKSDNPNIRRMVEDLPRLDAKKVPAFVPFSDDYKASLYHRREENKIN
jgi:ectoine hydroxylase-related dioxygenase (phytanoyl-CoA dioxygenase family)